MARTYLTLEYNGAEKALADWGFSKPNFRLESQAGADRFTVVASVAAAGPSAPLIPFNGWVIVRDGRIKSGLTGAFGGGLIIFQGSRIVLPKAAQPRGDSLTYAFLGPWHDLEITYYQQRRNVWAGGAFDNLRTIYSSEAVLFLKLDGHGGIQKQNVGDQIREILQYAIDQGARFVLGTIDPNHNVNTYQIRDTYCSEALNLCLRSCPDVAVYCDYATTPPTMHFRKRANRPPVTLTAGDKETHQSTKLTAREDLQIPSVSLYFRRENLTTINGDSFSFIEPMDQPPNWQLYPPGATGREPGNLIQTIDLQGVQFTGLTASITTEALKAVGSQGDQEDFWRRQHPQFAKQDGSGHFLVPALAISAVSVIDDATNLPVDLGQYPNELRKGELAKWMQFGTPGVDVKWIRATVSAEITYIENAPSTFTQRGYKPRSFTAPVVLTNAPSGPYVSVGSQLGAEEIPAGMAQAIWDSLAQLEFEGTHVFVEPSCAYSIGMQNTLNVAGGDPAWATMAASVRAIEREYDDGFVRTSVEVGPPPHLSAGDRVQLFLINRNRSFYFNPASIGSGQSSHGAGKPSTLGEQVPRENTNASLEQIYYSVVHQDIGGGQSTAIAQDGQAHVLTIGVFNQATQLPLWDKGGFEFRVSECLCSDGIKRKVYTQELEVYDANCNLMHRLFTCSDPF